MITDSVRAPGRTLNAADVLAAISTLDRAAGADSNFFRWRLRQWIESERQLALRRQTEAERA